VLTKTQQLNEYIMTSLRTIEGLDLGYVSKIFGEQESSRIKVAGRKYESTGNLKTVNDKLILTREGKLFADGIAADLFS
jgi:oxygen-independent coproporphyrinogen-3 oxidase